MEIGKGDIIGCSIEIGHMVCIGYPHKDAVVVGGGTIIIKRSCRPANTHGFTCTSEIGHIDNDIIPQIHCSGGCRGIRGMENTRSTKIGGGTIGGIQINSVVINIHITGCCGRSGSYSPHYICTLHVRAAEITNKVIRYLR